jgi:hypothetical protein
MTSWNKDHLMELKASYSNQCTVNVNAFGMRLCFGESLDGTETDARYHTAIFIPAAVIPGFHAMINTLVEQMANTKPPTKN